MYYRKKISLRDYFYNAFSFSISATADTETSYDFLYWNGEFCNLL